MNSSIEVTWQTDRIESFVILGTEFDIKEAKQLIIASPRPIIQLNTEDLRFISKWVATFWRIEVKADLTVPIIMASIGAGYLPIDGWHRIHRAFKKNIQTIPAVILTPDETRKIQKLK